jgi:hypothetical protein
LGIPGCQEPHLRHRSVKQGLIPRPAGQTLAGIYQRSDMPRDHGQPKGQNSPLRELLRDNDILGLPQWCQDSPIAGAVASHIPSIRFTYAEKRADERTRTADLISLRVRIHALQGLPEVANPRFLGQFPFCALPCVAPYCARGGVKVVSVRRWWRCTRSSRARPTHLSLRGRRSRGGVARSWHSPSYCPVLLARTFAGLCRMLTRFAASFVLGIGFSPLE